VEGALVESHEEDRVIASRCRVCAASEASPPRVPATREDLARALSSWAAEEGMGSPGELIEAYFVLATADEILAALARREPVETTFDVVDYLFSSGHGQGGSASTGGPIAVVIEPAPPSVRSAFAPPRGGDAGTEPTFVAPPSLRPVGGPYEELLALASVAASDGEASEDDLQRLAAAAAARGLPPLPPYEVRVRRPAEIPPPEALEQRERLIGEMFHMAWSDEELDESEVRVVREFARAWGVDPHRVTEWTAIVRSESKSSVARWIDRVGYFLFPGW